MARSQPAYDEIGAQGGLFAPAYIHGDPVSEAAVQRWNIAHLLLPPKAPGQPAPPLPPASAMDFAHQGESLRDAIARQVMIQAAGAGPGSGVAAAAAPGGTSTGAPAVGIAPGDAPSAAANAAPSAASSAPSSAPSAAPGPAPGQPGISSAGLAPGFAGFSTPADAAAATVATAVSGLAAPGPNFGMNVGNTALGMSPTETYGPPAAQAPPGTMNAMGVTPAASAYGPPQANPTDPAATATLAEAMNAQTAQQNAQAALAQTNQQAINEGYMTDEGLTGPNATTTTTTGINAAAAAALAAEEAAAAPNAPAPTPAPAPPAPPTGPTQGLFGPPGNTATTAQIAAALAAHGVPTSPAQQTPAALAEQAAQDVASAFGYTQAQQDMGYTPSQVAQMAATPNASLADPNGTIAEAMQGLASDAAFGYGDPGDSGGYGFGLGDAGVAASTGGYGAPGEGAPAGGSGGYGTVGAPGEGVNGFGAAATGIAGISGTGDFGGGYGMGFGATGNLGGIGASGEGSGEGEGGEGAGAGEGGGEGGW